MKFLEWSNFKSFVTSKELKINYVEDSFKYEIYSYDGPDTLFTEIFKSVDHLIAYPDTWDTDKTDFENNFKANANAKEVNEVKISPLPPTNVIWRENFFFSNGTNKDMDVNGSNNIDDFYYYPLESQEEYVSEIKVYLGDGGTWSVNNFGNLGSSLSNGVRLEVISNGSPYEIVTVYDNSDVILTFSDSRIVNNSATLFDGEEYYIGTMKFSTPMYLNDNFGDYLRIRIRDDLRNLSIFRAKAKSYRGV